MSITFITPVPYLLFRLISIEKTLWKSLGEIGKINFVILLTYKRGIKMLKETLILHPFELRVYIEYLRIKLMDIGQELGLCHELTIQASIELDYFINEYQKITS